MLTKATKIDFGDWQLVFVRQVAFIMFPLRRIIGNNITIALVRPAADFFFFRLLTISAVSLMKRFELYYIPFEKFSSALFRRNYSMTFTNQKLKIQ